MPETKPPDPLQEIERNQAGLREDIERSKKLIDESQRLLDSCRRDKERSPPKD